MIISLHNPLEATEVVKFWLRRVSDVRVFAITMRISAAMSLYPSD